MTDLTTSSLSDAGLVAEQLTVGYGPRVILSGLDLQIRRDAITAIIGPNGCGKSTLLRTLGGLLKPSNGSVLLGGEELTTMRTREIARRMAMLPQGPTAPEGMTVQELVARGRHPHQSFFRQWSVEDEGKVDLALELTGLTGLADRDVGTLSGGQRQRAWIAMTLAQDTDLLLLDEPTTYLDVSHSIEVLDLVERLHAELSRTVVMVIHDLNLAARYAHELVVMHDGEIVAQGPPGEVITTDLLSEVFDLKARLIVDSVVGQLIVPIGQRHAAE